MLVNKEITFSVICNVVLLMMRFYNKSAVASAAFRTANFTRKAQIFTFDKQTTSL